MDRNLNRRVEVVFPIENKDHIHHLRENVLGAYLRDNARARVMHPDGTYQRLISKDGHDKLDIQEWLMERNFKKKA
jgi:polyphosphate kinase